MTLFASLVPLLVVAVLLTIVLLVQLSPSSLAASVERLARRVNLALDDDVRAEVVRFQRRRTLSSVLGALAGAGLAFLLVPADWYLRSAVIVLGAFGGVAVGVAVAALRHARRAHRDAEGQTALSAGRLTPVEVADLVPPGERRGMPVAVAVSAGMLLLLLGALALAGQLDALTASTVGGGITLLALAGVSTALWRVAAERIARSRPVTGGTQALAWSDALRSVTLRDMIALPLTAAIYAPLVPLTELITRAEPPLSTIAGAALGLTALAAVAVAIVTAAMFEAGPEHRRSSRHYQRRLWPELADGGAR